MIVWLTLLVDVGKETNNRSQFALSISCSNSGNSPLTITTPVTKTTTPLVMEVDAGSLRLCSHGSLFADIATKNAHLCCREHKSLQWSH